MWCYGTPTILMIIIQRSKRPVFMRARHILLRSLQAKYNHIYTHSRISVYKYRLAYNNNDSIILQRINQNEIGRHLPFVPYNKLKWCIYNNNIIYIIFILSDMAHFIVVYDEAVVNRNRTFVRRKQRRRKKNTAVSSRFI